MSRGAQQALGSHTDPIIRTLKTVVKERIFVTTKPHPADPQGLSADLQFAPTRYLELRTDRQRGRLWIGYRQNLLVESRAESPGLFDIITTSVTYQLLRGDRRMQFDEVLTYHWTPHVQGSKRTWPHLHIGSAFVDPEVRRDPWAFNKAHLATGPLSAASFVQMIVEEFGVLPVVSGWDAGISE